MTAAKKYPMIDKLSLATKALDRIESILHDYVNDYYDDKPEQDPVVDIAEILDHYLATKETTP